MKRFFLHMLIAVAGLLSSAAQAEMQPMTTDEMDDVSGQNGIAFEIDMRINSTDTIGTPDPSVCPGVPGQAGVDRTQCRIANKFANRNYNGGEWLIMKGFSGRIYMPKVWIDATTTSASATPYADTNRLRSGTGVLMSPYSQLNLMFRMPAAMQVYNLAIRGMDVEYGTGLTAGTGFLADPTDSKSFIGININSPVSGQPATIRFDGQMQWWGF